MLSKGLIVHIMKVFRVLEIKKYVEKEV